MPFFGSKLSKEQQSEIQELVHQINELNAWHSEAFDTMAKELRDLFVACESARRSGLGRPLTVSDADLNMAREALTAYQSHTDSFATKLGVLHVEDWIPKKLRRSLAEASEFLQTERRFLSDTVMDALSPPLPLVDQPGKAKLNMFVSGLDLIATVVRSFRRPVKA